MNRVERIHQLLTLELSPVSLTIDDESALHAGHAGAASGGGHYRIRMISERFDGLGKLGRHRLVYDCLRKMMQKDIHALAMTLLTPAEAAASEA